MIQLLINQSSLNKNVRKLVLCLLLSVRNGKGFKELSLKDLPEIPVHYELKDTVCLCTDCGHTLHDDRSTIVREELLF
mgnify:FL=1